MASRKTITTPVLEIAYEEHGATDGTPIVLLHGFPYSPRAFDEVAPQLSAAGCHVFVPYLRGYGETRFRSSATPRSGQQAALGQDLLEFLDALGLSQVALAGYDWGGRAACIVSALWPQRVSCLVSVGGYNIQNIAAATQPAPPEHEHRLWYQYYFHTPRGRAGLEANRHALGKLLWRLWSHTWSFTDATYDATAASFENPDFVDVVIHSYRHRFGYAPGDPAYEALEVKLATQPVIPVPTIVLEGADDGVAPPSSKDWSAEQFTGPYERRLVAGAGHNLPQEKPAVFADAVLAALAWR